MEGKIVKTSKTSIAGPNIVTAALELNQLQSGLKARPWPVETLPAELCGSAISQVLYLIPPGYLDSPGWACTRLSQSALALQALGELIVKFCQRILSLSLTSHDIRKSGRQDVTHLDPLWNPRAADGLFERRKCRRVFDIRFG